MKYLVIAVALLVVAACGTMEPNSKFSQGVILTPGGTVAPGVAGNDVNTPQVTTPNGAPVTTVAGSTSNNANTSTNNGSSNGSNSNNTTTGNGNTGPNNIANSASDIGVTATTITIGNVTGVSGALGPNAFGVTLTGLKVWVAATNAAGGIHGRQIILKTCDDAQDSSQNLTCTQQVMPKSFAFIDNNSLSSNVSANSEYKAGIPDLGFPLNNGYYKYPNMFSNQTSIYPRDGKQVGFNGMLEQTAGPYRWMHDHVGAVRAAFFFYSQPASQQQGKASEGDAASIGTKTVYEGGGSGGENLAAPNFDSDVLAMKNMGANGPQVIYDAMDQNGNQKLCQSMDRFGYQLPHLTTVENWSQEISDTSWSRPCRDNMYAAAGSASYADTSNPEIAKYVDAFNRYAGGALQSEFGLQGYATGVIFGDYLAFAGASPTRKGFIQWLDDLPPLDQPNTYTDHGLFGPFSYRVRDPKQTTADCNTIVQWSDATTAWVTRGALTSCYQDPFIATPSTPDGS